MIIFIQKEENAHATPQPERSQNVESNKLNSQIVIKNLLNNVNMHKNDHDKFRIVTNFDAIVDVQTRNTLAGEGGRDLNGGGIVPTLAECQHIPPPARELPEVSFPCSVKW